MRVCAGNSAVVSTGAGAAVRGVSSAVVLSGGHGRWGSDSSEEGGGGVLTGSKHTDDRCDNVIGNTQMTVVING